MRYERPFLLCWLVMVPWTLRSLFVFLFFRLSRDPRFFDLRVSKVTGRDFVSAWRSLKLFLPEPRVLIRSPQDDSEIELPWFTADDPPFFD